jgi:tellurite resistance-related uncharacterized protein
MIQKGLAPAPGTEPEKTRTLQQYLSDPKRSKLDPYFHKKTLEPGAEFLKTQPKKPGEPETLKVEDPQTGQEYDLKTLEKLITTRPPTEKLLKQNEKIAKSGGKTYQFYNVTLPAYKGLWFDEREKKFKFVLTCPSAGKCKYYCYARKGGFVQYPASYINATRIVNFLMNDWKGYKREMMARIKQAHETNKKRGVVAVVRWHDSGDFFNEKYLQIAYDIARETPEVVHYAYTKSLDMVRAASNKPDNFHFTFSRGGLEDASIEAGDKVSYVVPNKLFTDIAIIKRVPEFNKDGSPKMRDGKHATKKSITFTPNNLVIMKERLKTEYNLDSVDNIILYDKLMKISYDHRKPNVIPRWHVIVKSGDGDDAAMRKDVKTVMLFFH